MAARVVFTSGFSRRYTGGVREFTVEARNLRGVIKEMHRLSPAWATISKKKPPSRSTALDETTYFQPIREGCEIFFIPKLEGG
jgi:sulfur-carrier protein